MSSSIGVSAQLFGGSRDITTKTIKMLPPTPGGSGRPLPVPIPPLRMGKPPETTQPLSYPDAHRNGNGAPGSEGQLVSFPLPPQWALSLPGRSTGSPCRSLQFPFHPLGAARQMQGSYPSSRPYRPPPMLLGHLRGDPRREDCLPARRLALRPRAPLQNLCERKAPPPALPSCAVGGARIAGGPVTAQTAFWSLSLGSACGPAFLSPQGGWGQTLLVPGLH